ncbi:metallophosphoesterase [Yinghuangia soli]|uniref:Metallophosphoesterase n=1 Tax=Yinghuangia soli TaxID=2908204 RepID=A0AA41Q3Y9_9ACTN|nr:metallophosphoesterase [Yinghuangia soli]MCF2530555.1 metallophosphoesterase [Yinghuangia soli]
MSTTAADPVTLVQISDLHFPDTAGVRGFVQHDPDAGLAAVLGHAAGAIAAASLVVATGDLADLGEPGAYERLGDVLDAVPAPVYCLSGNHDRNDAYRACLPRRNVHLETAVRVGSWLMLFLDSNARGREDAGDGTYRDRDDRMTAAEQPELTPAEAAQARAILEATSAEHVFVWLHHPPLPDIAPDAQGDTELAKLVRDFPKIRALGAGHLHGDLHGTFEGRPVFVCPSTTYSIDYAGRVFDGPSYRTYTLHADGTVESEALTVPGDITDTMRAKPAPKFLTDLMMGRITLEEMRELTDAEFEERFGEPRPTRGA